MGRAATAGGDFPMPPGLRRLARTIGPIVAVIVIGAIGIQYARDGWPFGDDDEREEAAPIRPERDDRVMTSGAGRDAEPRAHGRAAVQLGERQARSIGIRIEPVRRESVSRPIRAVATVVPDEGRVAHVHTRVAGWIERLHVQTTGEHVRAGQPLAEIFSQDLLATQGEYLALLAAGRGADDALVRGARSRLEVLGMRPAEIDAIERERRPRRVVTIVAPRAGIVLHRGVTAGTAVDPATELFTIADLSRVWVLAELSEEDIASVEDGDTAVIDVPASGLPPITARVELAYPTLSERTRTMRVRFVVPSPRRRLKPGMRGTASFRTEPRDVLTVARDAIVDTGLRQHVFVASDDGTYEPRMVRVGQSSGDRVEILEGLREGERVVASGVFLLDSESRLRASGGGTGHVHGGGGEDDAPEGAEGHEGHEAPERPRPRRAPAREPAPAAPAPETHEGHGGGGGH